MIYFVMRQNKTLEIKDPEPLALIRVNAREHGNMDIGMPRPTRFGPLAPVRRNGMHVYNLVIGDNEPVEAALYTLTDWRLEEVTQAEWETWAEMDLFPVLKTAVAR